MSVTQTDTIQILQNKLAEVEAQIAAKDEELERWKGICKLQRTLIENQQRTIDILMPEIDWAE